MRVELTLSFVFLFIMLSVGLWLGWRGRTRRQVDLPELPKPPRALGLDIAPSFSGMYLGTTRSRHWQDRVLAHGLGQRANVLARLTAQGVHLDRAGCDPLFIPDEALLDARLEAAIAGKVVGRGGVLVVRWRHGDIDLDTGLRGDDRTSYLPWIQAVASRTAPPADTVANKAQEGQAQ